jgi:hypothetical protein
VLNAAPRPIVVTLVCWAAAAPVVAASVLAVMAGPSCAIEHDGKGRK